MTSPQISNIPGAAVMTDTLDFVKNLWGSMGVPGIGLPGIATPTLSVDELEKKINDLKAVEAWLNLNATMVRSSIQALEVQRGTINALKSMGKTLAAAMQQPSSGEHSLFDTMPYAAFFQPPGAKTETAGKSAAKSSAAAPAKDEAKAEDKGAAGAKPSMADAASAAAAQMANPAIWWNLLQEQFKQAVSSTMAADLGGAAKPAAPGAAHDKAGAAQHGAAEAKDAAASQAAPAAKADGGNAGADAAKDALPAKPAGKGGSSKAAVNGAAKADTASSKAPARKPAAKRSAPQPK
ncbi:PhaM family polyhydroxyalkanoate granule multifunctional regulatory protein [Massilia sp. BJB1822]|uniref:PhaM family polyhydroxyalkanoate granule multifunctional regulatory protein n=1 Tax=Massilia sp. BJB1822 TaxID=2744470 RepID=UPI00159406D2|nr:PhaM family polyhydroxyalkanoate granule multifunctional regulatory protein [Massilia sp. BJB1822]NVD99542.1 hypothetical protein [Massilia sp. BJB1822]